MMRAAAGETAAESVLVQRTIGDVHRYCTHLVGAQRADDAVQSTYLRAFASIGGFRGDAPALAWLIGVARFTCYDIIRSAARRQRLDARVVELRFAAAAAADGDESASTMINESLRALAADDPDRYEAFVLTQVLGLSYADAAEIVGCPLGTIRSRVARARVSLSAWWQADSEGAPTSASS